MSGPQTNIAIKLGESATPQAQALPNLSSSSLMPSISGEGYKLVDRIVDPNAIYLDKLSVFLYSAHLVQSPIPDPESPVPGFKISRIGGENWKPNTNLMGYTTTMSQVLMALAEDGSVTRFSRDFKLGRYCARQTMAIIIMMVANRDDWEFKNYTIIYSFGLIVYKALVATLSRSMPEEGKRTLMDMLVHPNLWFTQNSERTEDPKNKWLNL